MKYYLICDASSSVIAIHKTADSAVACFHKLCTPVTRFVSLIRLLTDDYGITVSDTLLLTYSNRYAMTIVHDTLSSIAVLRDTSSPERVGETDQSASV